MAAGGLRQMKAEKLSNPPMVTACYMFCNLLRTLSLITRTTFAYLGLQVEVFVITVCTSCFHVGVNTVYVHVLCQDNILRNCLLSLILALCFYPSGCENVPDFKGNISRREDVNIVREAVII